MEQMTDQEDNIILGKIVFDDNNQKRKSWACLGQTCSRSLIVFLSQRFFICWSYLVAFGEFTFQKLVTNQLFGLEVYAVRQDTFYPHQECEQVNFYKKSSLYFNGWSIRNWKITADSQMAKNWNNSTKVWQNLLFLSTYPTSLRCYAKANWKTWVCARSKLWIYWFVKKQLYKVLLIIWRFLWRDLQFKSLCWHCHRWKTSGSEHNLH